MDALSIYLLGTFHVSYAGNVVDGFRTERERALLAYLAIECDRPHSRETLMGLLWPERSDKNARNNLRVNLHRLRKTVEKHTGQIDWLLVGRDSVQLNEELAIHLDVLRFEAHQMAAQRIALEIDSASPERLRHLSEAGKLYRGEFLQGFSLAGHTEFDHWALQTRERLHRSALQTLYDLCAMYIRRGELGKAMPAARRQLELEPWREEAHRQVIEILARRGERSAALAQFNQCQTVLREELGIEPGEQSRKLVTRIERLGSVRVRNLPRPSNPFIGRRTELDQIITYLSASGCRLLTLTGPGGSGKTRLALAASQKLSAAFLHGVCYVPLVAITEASEIAPAILEALGVPLVNQVQPNVQLRAYLRERELLLVLDNCEHLLPALRSTVAQLLTLSGIKLLATSRERLSVPGETVVPLGGLTVFTDRSPAGFSAGRLFLQHARRQWSEFELDKESADAIVRICQLLDGMPLALELAASWLGVLSPTELATEIERDLSLLGRTVAGVASRHQGMEVVFEQSWVRLSPGERQALSGLSIFAAPFDRQAAEAVAGAKLTVLAELVNKSLVQREELATGGRSRYALHPLLRHFAAAKLRQDPLARQVMQAKFVDYYSRFLERRKGLLLGPEHSRAMAEILTAYNNLHAAMRLACETGDIDAIGRYLFPMLVATFMSGISLTEAKRLFNRMGDALEAVLNESTIVSSDEQAILARALAYEAWFGLFTDGHDAAEQALRRARLLAERSGDREIMADTLNALAIVCRERGDFAEAEELFRQALDLVDAPNYPYAWWQQGSYHNNLGVSYLRQQKFAQARKHFEQGHFAFDRAESDLGLNGVLRGLGDLSLQEGDYPAARAHYEEALATTRRLGSQFYEAQTLIRMINLALEVGEEELADDLLVQARRIGEALGAGTLINEVDALQARA